MGFKTIGVIGVAAGLMLVTGCVEPMGPAASGASQVQGPAPRSIAHTSDSNSVSACLSLGRMGTATLDATFKSTGQ